MASLNYYDVESSFLAFSASKGFGTLWQVEADGKIHRFSLEGDKHGERSGAYLLWPEGRSFDGKPHGWLQDFHEGGEKHFWQYYNRDNPPPKKRLTDAERHAARTRREAEERQEAEHRREALKLAYSVYQAAQPIWEASDHPYLLEKHVRPVGPLRVGSVPSKSGKQIGGVLFIPMCDVLSGEFVALHRVFPWRDKETGRFPKGWHPGTCGGVFTIAEDVRRGPVFVCEGVATALTAYDLWVEEGTPEAPGEFVPSCTVVAAMDSGNLVRQARGIRRKYANRRLLIVKDDDEAGAKASIAALEADFDGVVDVPRAG
ncbi:MAG: hypothetical protein LBS45_07085 [Synergistaceae bacterium]|jgi:putative DNA primase/helicase|nr:hypothetical protein [Synergistaceae bacterium]